MSNVFFKLKRDVLFLILVVSAFACACFDVAILIFDIIELVAVKSNSANLSGAFLGLNVTAIVLNVLCVAYVICYLILKKKKIYAVIPKK